MLGRWRKERKNFVLMVSANKLDSVKAFHAREEEKKETGWVYGNHQHREIVVYGRKNTHTETNSSTKSQRKNSGPVAIQPGRRPGNLTKTQEIGTEEHSFQTGTTEETCPWREEGVF